MRAHRFSHRLFFGLLPLLLLLGCASNTPKVSEQAPPLPPQNVVQTPPFPPRKVMESGDYAGFLNENQKTLKGCAGEEECGVALFNLGFLHAYSRSSYYSPSKALHYFDELIRKYPQSPWAFQAQAWVDIIKRAIAYQNKCRQLQGELKSRDTAISELNNQMERSRDIDVEMDQKERELLQ